MLLNINSLNIIKMKKAILTLFFLLTIHFVFSQVLIPKGSFWKYLDDGSNQGTSWREVSFNDNGWSSGKAQLGYGDGDENTKISYGSSSNNKHICYYFRKTFTVSDPNAASGLNISLLRDDGAVVYINGFEVARSNMPSGNISYSTVAASTVSGSAEGAYYKYNISSSILNAGNNIIAVEVHQRSSSSTDLSFDLKLEFGDYNYYKKLPYVIYPGSNNEMIVLWQLKDTETCTFKYGTDTNYSNGTITTNEYSTDHQHKVALTGLSVDQKYYYQVSVDNSSVREGSFNTGAPDSAQTMTFFAYGDTRSNPDDHDQVAARIMSDISQNNLKQTFVMNSGDLVSNGDLESSWQSEFFNQQYTHITELLGNLPYMSAMGNHEEQGILFGKYFPYPMFQNNRYYYSFDYGPAHITVIDEETDFLQGSTQYNWIVNDLSSTNKGWKIVMLHKPGWSAGGHSNSTEVQNTLQPLFKQYNVKVVITGHNHYYARASVNGVQHITTGGGGAPLYDPDSSYPNIIKVDKSNHYCKLEINNRKLHFSAIRSDGSLIEAFNVQIPNADNIETINSLVSIYPNPASSYVIVEGDEINRIKITDINGRIIKQLFPSGEIINRISLSNINKGLYLVFIKTPKEVTVKKIIIK